MIAGAFKQKTAPGTTVIYSKQANRRKRTIWFVKPQEVNSILSQGPTAAEWGPPITGIGWPAPLVGRPAYGSRLSVSTLLCALHRLCGSFSTVYEGRFQVGSSNGNQGKMKQIDDVAPSTPSWGIISWIICIQKIKPRRVYNLIAPYT